MPSWSDGEGGGPFHEALAGILGNGQQPGDMLFFASAGNTARRHWSGTFQDGGDGFHRWQPGETDNVLVPWGSGQVSVEMFWHPGASYRLVVLDAGSGSTVGRVVVRRRTERTSAVVRFTPQARHGYVVRVQRLTGEAGPFHVVALGGDLCCSTARGSIACPADGAAVIAVGAVTANGQRAWYSSCGPNSRCPKPDLVAPVPFPSRWRAAPFTGTSAAAPQAAGMAALLWSRHPDWTAAQVRQALRTSAEDLGPPGHDFETGYGLVHLPGPESPLPTDHPVQAAYSHPPE
jgi:subtilisin family serine protease